MLRVATVLVALSTLACGRVHYEQRALDAGARDGGARDAGPLDGGPLDGGPLDGGPLDGGAHDSGADAGDGGPSGGDAGPGPLDDEFDGSGLGDRWRVVNPDRGDPAVSDGVLRIRATAQGQWFANDEGSAVVTRIDGDFAATALVEVVQVGGGPPAGTAIEMGGLIVLDPMAPGNHVWVGVGADASRTAREAKSTTDGASLFTQLGYPESRAAVRLCRVGGSIVTSTRPYLGGAWDPIETYDRADLASSIEVGIFASDNEPTADIEVRVDWIRFTRPTSLADCDAP